MIAVGASKFIAAAGGPTAGVVAAGAGNVIAAGAGNVVAGGGGT